MSFKTKQMRKLLGENKHRCESGTMTGQQKITVNSEDLERLIIEAEAVSEKEARIVELENEVIELEDFIRNLD